MKSAQTENSFRLRFRRLSNHKKIFLTVRQFDSVIRVIK